MTEHTHGGARTGAGRKKGSGRFGEQGPLVQIRVPEQDKGAVIDFVERRIAARSQHLAGTARQLPPYPTRLLPAPLAAAANVPVFASKLRAGLPSPADDHVDDYVDLNALLLTGERFMVRVEGDSMTGAGIDEGDLLVIDPRRTARDGDIVLAGVDGEPTVKRLQRRDARVVLLPENARYAPIVLGPHQELTVWGVVCGCVKQF